MEPNSKVMISPAWTSVEREALLQAIQKSLEVRRSTEPQWVLRGFHRGNSRSREYVAFCQAVADCRNAVEQESACWLEANRSRFDMWVAPTEPEGVDLDELQQATEELLAQLRDRQPGLHTWNEALSRRLRKLQYLAARTLRK